jgi:DNA-binding SARP family transcriptional activator
MAHLYLYLFGLPRLQLDQRELQIRSRKALALLAYLALSAQPHTRDHLANLFWAEKDPSTSRAFLRNLLWVLKKAGLQDWLALEADTVSLKPGYTLDVAVFLHQAGRGRQHSHERYQACPACQEALFQAAELYQEGFLAGFSISGSQEFDEWQLLQSESLRQVYSGVLERLVWLQEAGQEFELALAYARRWVALDPLHEPAHRLLMQLLAAADQPAAALRQYHELCRRLVEELGVEPAPETVALYETIRLHRVLPSQRQIPPRSNLPAPTTSFIGRQREVSEVIALLTTANPPAGPARLVTLSGPGGSGKTRLALEVAGRLLNRFPDGVFFVDLAPLLSPESVASTVSRALQVAEAPGRSIADTLKDYLRSRQLLLVLDNFEHLLAAASLVGDLLSAAPNLTTLVTSREVLHLYGERVYPVPPMALPQAGGGLRSSDLAQNESVQLFSARAKAVQPDFDRNDAQLRLIAEICTHLDGLPLAIELAAA